jgi:hypothetical protein
LRSWPEIGTVLLYIAAWDAMIAVLQYTIWGFTATLGNRAFKFGIQKLNAQKFSGSMMT